MLDAGWRLSGDKRLVLSPSGQLCEAESCSLVKHNNETFLIFDTAACLLVILKSYERKCIFWGCLDWKADGLGLQVLGKRLQSQAGEWGHCDMIVSPGY